MAISDNIRSAPKLFFVTLIFLFLGGLFVLTATASPYWQTQYTNNRSVHRGLWEFCVETTCAYINPSERLIACRAFSMAALLWAGGCGVMALAYVQLEQQRKQLAYVVPVGCIVSSLLNLTTIITYSVTAVETQFVVQFGWSFIISCLGSTCLLFGGFTGFVMACKHLPLSKH